MAAVGQSKFLKPNLQVLFFLWLLFASGSLEKDYNYEEDEDEDYDESETPLDELQEDISDEYERIEEEEEEEEEEPEIEDLIPINKPAEAVEVIKSEEEDEESIGMGEELIPEAMEPSPDYAHKGLDEESDLVPEQKIIERSELFHTIVNLPLEEQLLKCEQLKICAKVECWPTVEGRCMIYQDEVKCLCTESLDCAHKIG